MRTRILEIVSSLSPAGAENVVSYLASGFDPSRFEAAVVSLYDPQPQGLEASLEKKGVQIWHLGKHGGFDPAMFFRLEQIVRRFRPHVIHSHCYVLRYLLHISGPIMAHTVHNIASAEVNWFGRLIHRYMYRRGVLPIAVGRAVAKSFTGMYGFAPAATIANGIDTARFCRPDARNAWRRANGFRDDEILIVSTGRLVPQKNPVGLARAVARIPNAQLLFAGEGDLRPLLEGRERVHLLGMRDDIPEILAAADVFALSSDWEGLPLAVIEAMAAGLPVVATDVGSVSEAVEHRRTGILVPPGDPVVLTEALSLLAGDPAMRREMGLAGRERAQLFGVRSMVTAYEELFSTLLKSGVPSRGARGRFKSYSPAIGLGGHSHE